ncbi:MAG: hypothetical protein K6D58_03255 [Treponema sp.]|nr:hypothetical protein [Treponema sp.]
MNNKQWEVYCNYRDEYKKLCKEWNKFAEELRPLQIAAAAKDTPPYPLETAVVYNRLYDEITKDDRISLIVVGDNPGKEEQLLVNNKYLVGQSGRIAEGFFKRNPELNIDFRKNVVITNKTPVHTAKTNHLKYLLKNGSKDIQELLLVSQNKMAELTADLHQGLCEYSDNELTNVSLWLVGYSELKEKGIFKEYRKALLNKYKNQDGTFNEYWNRVFIYQHFSMNRFLIDLKEYSEKVTNDSLECNLQERINKLGWKHRDEILL